MDLLKIDIPQDFQNLARVWNQGPGDQLYDIAVTGVLQPIGIRPLNDDYTTVSDEEWHLALWDDVCYDLRVAKEKAEKIGRHGAAEGLAAFAKFTETTHRKLAVWYKPLIEIEIEIPKLFVRLAGEWHDGMDSRLYAVSSTGGLTLGDIRPKNDDDEPMANCEWHLYLWEGLVSELESAINMKTETSAGDAYALDAFTNYARAVVERLRKEYGLTS